MHHQGTAPFPHDAAEEIERARKRLRGAAEAFAAVVLQHAESLCGTEGEAHEILALTGPLREAAHRFQDAQFDLTGVFPALDDRGGEDEDHQATEPSERIAVLIRHDFLISDREALIAAGRAAYLRMRPDDIADAESDVQTADDAIYEIMHASREDTILEGAPGVRPTASVQTTRDVSEPLDFDAPFAVY